MSVNFSLKGLLKLLYNSPPPPGEDPRRVSDNFNRLARGTYPNGLEAEFKYDPAEVINIRIHVRSGSNSDPPGRDGCAHYTEHMSFCGNAETQALLREFRSAGGKCNASTGNDQTVYEFSVPRSEDNEKLLYRLSSRIVFNHDMNPDQFENEREILTTEMDEKVDNSRYDPVLYLASHSFGLDKPFFLENGGSRQTLAAMNLQDIVDFRRKHYVASNMKVVVTGGLPQSTCENLRTYFGSQPMAERPDKSGDRKASYSGGYSHVDAPESLQTYVGVAFPYPERERDPPRKVYAERQILDEYVSAAIEDSLRGERDRRVYRVEPQRCHFRDIGLFTVTTNARSDRADAVLPAIAGVMNDLAAGRVDPVLFRTAVAQSKRNLAEIKESNDFDPRGTDNVLDRMNFYKTDQQTLDSLTPDDLTALAGKMLREPPGMVTMGDITCVQSYDQFVSMLSTTSAAPQQAPVPAVT